MVASRDDRGPATKQIDRQLGRYTSPSGNIFAIYDDEIELPGGF
jgi:hypothetical protein